MTILQIFQLISLGLSAVTQMEATYTEAKQGILKKAGAIKLFIAGLATAKAAGAPISEDMQTELAPVAGDIIEGAVTFAKQVGLIAPPAAGPDK